MRNKFWLCLLVAALTLCGLCACAETEIVPGMLMTAGETFYDEEFGVRPREYHTDVPDSIVPGSDASPKGPLWRGNVTYIYFLDSLADVPKDVSDIWDMSALGDGSVMAWADRTGDNDITYLYIAAEGGVKANPDSSYLFAGYCQDSMRIYFDGNFDTSTAVDMTGMFQDAQYSNQETDFSELDTSNVTSMRNMFWHSSDMYQVTDGEGYLDLSEWDTSKVADMSGMFRDSGAMQINLASFTTESLEHSEGMFAESENLHNLLLSEEFDLDSLAPDAFEGCGDVEVSRWEGPYPKPGMLKRSAFLYDEDWYQRKREIVRVDFLNSLDGAPEDAWDFSAAGDGSVLAWTEPAEGEGLRFYLAAEGGVKANPDSAYLFYDWDALREVHFNGSFDLSTAWNLHGMFAYCSSLAEMDFTGVDLGQGFDYSDMFFGCESLDSVDGIAWDEGGATREMLEMMFVPGMLMNAGETFYDEEFGDAERDDYTVPEGIVPGSDAWEDGPQSRTSVSTICFLDSLADAPADAWDMSALGDGSVLGWVDRTGDNDITYLYIAAEGGVKANPDSSYLFAGYGNMVNETDIEFNGNFDSSAVVDTTGMFQDSWIYTAGTDFKQLGTSNATCMRDMFWHCNDFEGSGCELSGWDTSKVTDMSGMFRDCGMGRIKLAGWTTESLEHSEGMFAGCEGLSMLLLGEDFDPDALAPDAFEGCGDVKIARWEGPYPLPGMLKSRVSLFAEWFEGEGSVERVDFLDNLEGAPEDAMDFSAAGDGSVLGWEESAEEEESRFYIAAEGGVKANPDSAYLFAGWYRLRELHFNGNFDTSTARDMSCMFERCRSLTELDFSGLDVSGVVDFSRMFSGCETLSELEGFSWNEDARTEGMFEGTPLSDSEQVS